MLKVRIAEDWRNFKVIVGHLVVGTIVGHKGHFCCYKRPLSGGEKVFLSSETTLRRAMQVVLQAQGFGKSSPKYKLDLEDVA